MDKYAILLGYFEKQHRIIEKLKNEITPLDLAIWENGYVFAMKAQQLFTALEDLFKQIAKSFENHIEDLGNFHRELLVRMNTEIPGIRPAVIQQRTFIFLDKLRAFRHFIRHAYDVELDQKQLMDIQSLIKNDCTLVFADLNQFHKYLILLSK